MTSPADPRHEPILTVADLSVRIAGLHILQGVSFTVAPRGVTVLLGRNGVGKTTTLRAVLGLTPRGGEVRGTVRMAGRSLTGESTHRLVRAGLGYVPEDRCVFAGLTVAENLRLAERRSGVAAPGVGDTAAVGRAVPDYDRVYELFPELKRRGRQRAGSLSGGQQQMLAIGRVLLNDNRLLLVDEPTKGLAPKVVTEVAEVLERVAVAVPVLLVEQNLAVVRRLARDAVVLAAGRVAWTGDAGGLLRETELTRSLLGVGTHGETAAPAERAATGAVPAPADATGEVAGR
ncbi:ABC transporter ATP-binding protein [Plantactinospora sp. CA-290183]|uniref:ABC transporter ATP-binding protein n=1 Tax=Plantactinospora sp. CA-290183 TaxID=3240006 RepID=UPI003D8A4A6D